MRHRKRYERAYRLANRFLLPVLRRLFNIEAVPASLPDGPFLLFANHNTDLDPAIIHLSFDRLLYFVASEHALRRGPLAFILKRYFAPIPRLKGSTDIGTVKGILQRLQHGVGVCIFAEGNRSFNGITGPIPLSIAKLAKIARVPVLTYRFEGGYFTSPRWSLKIRKGAMKGYVVNIYEPEMLAQMSIEEIDEAIRQDLYEDAYMRQEKMPVAFRGANLAEALETTLYLCPSCRKIGTMRSEKDRLLCTCGLDVSYSEHGDLNGGTHRTITAWDKEQQKLLAALLTSSDNNKLLFSDHSVTLKEVLRDGRERILLDGTTLALYPDRILSGSHEFSTNMISDMALAGRNTVLFTYKDRHYEWSAGSRFCGKKYFDAFTLLKRKG
jgi:1-acyl-sn-glycerol-3-phosphate acyltransferase